MRLADVTAGDSSWRRQLETASGRNSWIWLAAVTAGGEGIDMERKQRQLGKEATAVEEAEVSIVEEEDNLHIIEENKNFDEKE